MANGNILKIEEVLNLNVNEVHTFLAHKKDKGKLMIQLRKQKQ